MKAKSTKQKKPSKASIEEMTEEKLRGALDMLEHIFSGLIFEILENGDIKIKKTPKQKKSTSSSKAINKVTGKR